MPSWGPLLQADLWGTQRPDRFHLTWKAGRASQRRWHLRRVLTEWGGGIPSWDQPGQRPRDQEVLLGIFCSLMCVGDGVGMR